MQQQVESREYKVMLKKERFVGSQADLIKQSEKFWKDFKNLIQDIVFDTDGSLDKLKKNRKVSFYDTVDCHLRKNNYVFRERVDCSSEKREVVLKFRHPDRYISQDRSMAAYDVDKGKTKFEEDIKLPFIKLYSFSTKQAISSGKSLNKLSDPGELYPDLQTRLMSYQENEAIDKVGDFTAREVVIGGADFQIGNDPKVEAECAVVAWYDCKAEEDDKPVVVEFSFKYEGKHEKFDGEVAQRAYDVFGKLKELLEWVEPEGLTKTAYVYSRSSC